MVRGYDFFRQLDCLDRNKSRTENLTALKTRYNRIRKGHSSKDRIEQAVLDQALKVFTDEQEYQDYLRNERSEEDARTSREEDAHRRAREAEAAKRQEAERRMELERLLEKQREQTEEAEREAQRAKNQGSGGWGAVFKGVFDAIAERHEPAPSRELVYPPEPLNLTGDWRTPDGYLCRIWQIGNSVRIQAWDPWDRFIGDSSGIFDGQVVRVNFETVPLPTMRGLMRTHGVATYRVLSAGRMLQGQIVNYVTGAVANVVLHRAS